jgi:Flp pilus assembly protein CpaB
VFGRVFNSRYGTIALAAILAIAAALVVLVYANRESETATGDVTVLVATQEISEFTPGSQVVDGNMYREQQLDRDLVADGAVSNPDQLDGLVARDTIYPGEQLTVNQFQKSDTTSVAVKLEDDQRAVAFPVEAAQGMVNELQPGDHVDVVGVFDVMPLGPTGLPVPGAQEVDVSTTLATDVLVLKVPDTSDTSSNKDDVLTLAIPINRVQHVVFAQERADVYFVLRPPGSTREVAPVIDDVSSVLAGVNGAPKRVVAKLTGGR